MKKIVHQHGDLLIEKIDFIPANAKPIKVCENFILERGEGRNTHVLKNCKSHSAVKEGISPDELNNMMDFVEVYENGEDMYIKVIKEVNLDHEEHGIQTLEPGIYKKNIEREYSYELNEERRVID